jgi:GWxTD domain-containing protein
MKRGAVAVVLVLLAGAAGARSYDPVDLINVNLSPQWASFLVGPYARMASDEEIREYLALTRDEDAAAFVDRFWARRKPDPARPFESARKTAEARAEEADRRFNEAGVAGRRTDRGTVFVLYGEPEKTAYEPSPLYGEPPLEVWTYPADAPRGLDGKSPRRTYQFIKRDDLTRFYIPGRPGRYTQRDDTAPQPRPPGGGR